MVHETRIHDAMIAAALAAGAVILAHYDEQYIEARVKDDSSPVTVADEAAEEEIIKLLSAELPFIPIVSEEQASAGNIPYEAQRFFLVDPLDGTKEFIGRNGEFTVNIALIDGGRPVAGVVYAPALARIFFGVVGQGARESRVIPGEDLVWRSIQVRKTGDAGLVAVASRSHAGGETDAYLGSFNIMSRVSAGSSLKFCLIAAGEADIYPRLGRTMEWDTAAGHALLSAAGGCVLTLDGIDLKYGKRHQVSDAAFANPHFVALASPELASRQ